MNNNTTDINNLSFEERQFVKRLEVARENYRLAFELADITANMRETNVSYTNLIEEVEFIQNYSLCINVLFAIIVGLSIAHKDHVITFVSSACVCAISFYSVFKIERVKKQMAANSALFKSYVEQREKVKALADKNNETEGMLCTSIKLPKRLLQVRKLHEPYGDGNTHCSCVDVTFKPNTPDELLDLSSYVTLQESDVTPIDLIELLEYQEVLKRLTNVHIDAIYKSLAQNESDT